jgi:hypothetical protein
VTPDGRFAARHSRIDVRGLMSSRTEAIQEAIANAPERWRRFLEADDKAAPSSSSGSWSWERRRPCQPTTGSPATSGTTWET